jgi:hypothetical protein
MAETVQSKQKKKKGGFFKGIIIGLILAAAAALAIWVFLPSGVKIGRISKEVNHGIQNIGKLTAREYDFTIVEQFDSSKQLAGKNIPFTQSEFIYSYDGKVTAGVDFTLVKREIDTAQKTVRVDMPKAEIFSCEIYEDSFVLYSEKNSVFNRISVRDVNDSIANLKAKATAQAKERGLLLKANENAESLLKNFIASFVGEEYEIIFY